jgi:hypothetical protein
VHVLKADNCILSNQEIKNIVEAKTGCILSRTLERQYQQSPPLIIISPPG